MPPKKSSHVLRHAAFLVCVALAAFSLGVYREEVRTFYDTQAPVVKDFAVQKGPVVVAGARAGWRMVENGVTSVWQEGREIYRKRWGHTAPSERTDLISAPSRRSAVHDGELQLASFNIRIFSSKSRKDDELRKIAELIQEHDVVAVQELRDEDVLKRTIAMLKASGHDFAYEISAPVGKGVKERYAFLYRTSKVESLESAHLYPDPDDRFIREPYIGRFRSGAFDFVLVTVHILYGKSPTERRPEIDALADVYAYVEQTDPSERDIIVMGDFNMPPTDSGWGRLKDWSTMTHLISDPDKTTVTDTSLYDNVWFQQEAVREYKGRAGVDRFDEWMFENDDASAKLAVSDHRPVWAVFDREMYDDD